MTTGIQSSLGPEGIEELDKSLVPGTRVLEYGAGESTLRAVRANVTSIFSVESDPNWIDQVQSEIDRVETTTEVHLHHANIGPTGKWGVPTEIRNFRDFPGYAVDVWTLDGFEAPDLVIIDGRFRVSCFFTTMLLIRKKTKVLFDDYDYREGYQKAVEQIVKPTRKCGYMAVFDLEPSDVTPETLQLLMRHSVIKR